MRRELLTFQDPKSPVSEVFRTLRTNIQFMNSKKSLKTLLITSTMPGEGKTWVSSNLAITFAQAGKRVVIVDADMRKGRLHTMFQIDSIPGLSNYLSGINGNDNAEEDILKYVKQTEIENLYVIPSGNIPPNPSELLASEATNNMLERLKEVFDIIILDGTPSLLVTDAIILSRDVDSTIIVTAHKATKKDGLEKVKKAIENVGGKIAGVVINKIPVNIEKYESTYYYSSSSAREEKSSNKYSPKTTGNVSKEKSDEIMQQLNDFLKNNKN